MSKSALRDRLEVIRLTGRGPAACAADYLSLVEDALDQLDEMASAIDTVIDSYKNDGDGKPPTYGRPNIKLAWRNVATALARYQGNKKPPGEGG